MLLVNKFYYFVSCSCIFLFSTIIQTIYHLRLFIFVLDNKLPAPTYYFCVTIKCFRLINFIDLFAVPVCCCFWKLSKRSFWCPLIFMLLLTHDHYLNIVSDDNSFPKELAPVTFRCITSICNKTNTNSLHTNPLNTILHKFGHVRIQICIQDTNCTIPTGTKNDRRKKILSLKKSIPLEPQIRMEQVELILRTCKTHENSIRFVLIWSQAMYV
jgi:hypothetical protein